MHTLTHTHTRQIQTGYRVRVCDLRQFVATTAEPQSGEILFWRANIFARAVCEYIQKISRQSICAVFARPDRHLKPNGSTLVIRLHHSHPLFALKWPTVSHSPSHIRFCDKTIVPHLHSLGMRVLTGLFVLAVCHSRARIRRDLCARPSSLICDVCVSHGAGEFKFERAEPTELIGLS